MMLFFAPPVGVASKADRITDRITDRIRIWFDAVKHGLRESKAKNEKPGIH